MLVVQMIQLDEVDVVCQLIEATAPVGPGDRFIAYLSRRQTLDGHGTIVGQPYQDLEKLYRQQSAMTDFDARKKLVWEIDKKLQEDAARPVIYQTQGATCWWPHGSHASSSACSRTMTDPGASPAHPIAMLVNPASTAAHPGLVELAEHLLGPLGLTVVLTTHYLEEAERCDRVAVVDRGRVVGLDTPQALTAMVGDVPSRLAAEYDNSGTAPTLFRKVMA